MTNNDKNNNNSRPRYLWEIDQSNQSSASEYIVLNREHLLGDYNLAMMMVMMMIVQIEKNSQEAEEGKQKEILNKWNGN